MPFDPGTGSVQQRLEVGAYFSAWYALNVWYNIENKKVLKLVGLPWSVSVRCRVHLNECWEVARRTPMVRIREMPCPLL